MFYHVIQGQNQDEKSRKVEENNIHVLREIENFNILKSNPHDNIIRFLFACSIGVGLKFIGLEYFEGEPSKDIEEVE